MFADTSGWASYVDRRQTFHAATAALVREVRHRGENIVTSSYVLAELTALLTSPLRMPRPQQIQFLAQLRATSWIEIVFVDARLESAAWNLWQARPDKDWTIVDCTSFVIMQQRGLDRALTTDHHFEQAGYVRLLK